MDPKEILKGFPSIDEILKRPIDSNGKVQGTSGIEQTAIALVSLDTRITQAIFTIDPLAKPFEVLTYDTNSIRIGSKKTDYNYNVSDRLTPFVENLARTYPFAEIIICNWQGHGYEYHINKRINEYMAHILNKKIIRIATFNPIENTEKYAQELIHRSCSFRKY